METDPTKWRLKLEKVLVHTIMLMARRSPYGMLDSSKHVAGAMKPPRNAEGKELPENVNLREASEWILQITS